MSNLRQTGLAFHLHHDAKGHFPNATAYGTTFYSAFTAVLPYVEQGNRFALYDDSQRYSSLHNKHVIEQEVPVYLCPSMVIPRAVPDLDPMCAEIGAPGSYAVSTGTNNPWAGPHNGAIIFARTGVTSFKSISDGTSRTLLVGELDYGLSNFKWGPCNDGGVRWGATRWGSGYPGVSIGTTFGIYNSDQLVNGIAEFVTFRSDHLDGSNFLLADGSTHFFVNSIDETVLDALATREGFEATDDEW